jgi:hypothetical protein
MDNDQILEPLLDPSLFLQNVVVVWMRDGVREKTGGRMTSWGMRVRVGTTDAGVLNLLSGTHEWKSPQKIRRKWIHNRTGMKAAE